jgi:hypothetical protein
MCLATSRRPQEGMLDRWQWVLSGLWVPLAYTAVTLVMTYPAALHLCDHVLSGGPDAWIFWLKNWWVCPMARKFSTSLPRDSDGWTRRHCET